MDQKGRGTNLPNDWRDDCGAFFEIPDYWQRSDFGEELGWSKERFGFWKKRFDHISSLEGQIITQATKDLAREAAETMESIERNVKP